MLTDFRNFSIVEFIKKCATNRLSHCPTHLRRVATLPCEMTVVTNTWTHAEVTRWLHAFYLCLWTIAFNVLFIMLSYSQKRFILYIKGQKKLDVWYRPMHKIDLLYLRVHSHGCPRPRITYGKGALAPWERQNRLHSNQLPYNRVRIVVSRYI